MTVSGKVLDQRKKVYGDILDGFEGTRTLWTGLLREHYGPSLPELPKHVAAAMMTVMKIGRACRPTPFNPDDYIDGANYLDTAYRARKANP